MWTGAAGLAATPCSGGWAAASHHGQEVVLPEVDFAGAPARASPMDASMPGMSAQAADLAGAAMAACMTVERTPAHVSSATASKASRGAQRRRRIGADIGAWPTRRSVAGQAVNVFGKLL